MSRTYRDHATCSGFGRWYIGVAEDARGRDRKPLGAKPPKWFKQICKASRRAKERQAMRNGIEPPLFKRSDVWDWN